MTKRRSVWSRVRDGLERATQLPPVGTVSFGMLRRTTPVNREFGTDRGQPIDRYYIERFLDEHRHDIRGRVLEIGEATYARRFGGDAVTQIDVLHAVEGNEHATLVGDLASGNGIPSDTFDCIVLSQTLPFIYDVASALKHSYGALRAGGVLIATLPGISQISRYDMDRWGDYWRFTTLSATRLFEGAFPPERITVSSQGNVLAAVAFLHGLVVEDVSRDELDEHDPDYPVTIGVRAVKPATPGKS